MLVEFFGLPGAGKSSMSRHVAEVLLRKGLIVNETTYNIDHMHRRPARFLLKFGHVARFAGANPRQAVSFCTKVAATQQASSADLGKEAFNWLFVASLASRMRSGGGITVLDQGVAQALWSIGHAARHASWLELVLDEARESVMGPDLVIFVRASLPTIRHRLSKRDPHVSRLERDLGRDDRPLLRAQANSDAVIRKLKARGVSVVEVANDDREQMAIGGRLVTSTICSMLRDRGFARGSLEKVGSDG